MSTMRANAFVIWRAGTSVNWDCTTYEICQETGIHYTTVRRIISQRGWPIKRDTSNWLLGNRFPVDRLMDGKLTQGHD